MTLGGGRVRLRDGCPLASFISAVLGLLIACVGNDAMSAIARLTFTNMNLLDGGECSLSEPGPAAVCG